jgi:hypothetical protein
MYSLTRQSCYDSFLVVFTSKETVGDDDLVTDAIASFVFAVRGTLDGSAVGLSTVVLSYLSFPCGLLPCSCLDDVIECLNGLELKFEKVLYETVDVLVAFTAHGKWVRFRLLMKLEF